MKLFLLLTFVNLKIYTVGCYNHRGDRLVNGIYDNLKEAEEQLKSITEAYPHLKCDIIKEMDDEEK